MLHLNPPYHVIDGHTLLPDHADSNLFYAIPPAPQLAVSAAGSPELSLLQFLGGSSAQRLEGALLTLALELSLSNDTLNELARKLSDKTGGRAPPRIVPVLFDEGVVELVALGTASAAPAADSESERLVAAGKPPFSVRILGSGKPSLDATNRSSFQLVLDASAAELLEHAIDTADVPIIALYRMGLSGLRPSFEIDVKANFEKLYRGLQNKFNLNVYYVSVDADVKLSDALEEAGIRIDTTVFGAGTSAQAAAARARQQLVDWIYARLFVSMVDPNAATANAIGQVIDDTVTSLVRAVQPGLSYKLRAVQEHELRTMSARMNESVAERREIVPQGTLGGVLQRFRLQRDGSPNPGWAALRTRLIQKVNLDGFPRIEVRLGVEDRFASDGVSRVDVEMSRVDTSGVRSHQRSFSFRSAAEQETFVVNLLGVADPRLEAPYEYRYSVHFDPAHALGAHAPVSSGWTLGRAGRLTVEPRSPSTYSLARVRVMTAPTFSFSRFPHVTVEFRVGDENAIDFRSARLELGATRQEGEWLYRSFGAADPPYRFRTTFHGPPERPQAVQSEWLESRDDLLSLQDPLPHKRPVTLLVALPWDQLRLAFVELHYEDPVNDVVYDEQIDLDPQTLRVRRDIPIAEHGPRTLSYRLTLWPIRGPLMAGSWRDTEDDRLVLDSTSVTNRVVRVRTLGGSLSDNALSQVDLRLHTREPDGLAVRDQISLSISEATGVHSFPPWEFLIGDPPVREVHFDATFVDRNGFTDTTPTSKTLSDAIIVNLRTRSAFG